MPIRNQRVAVPFLLGCLTLAGCSDTSSEPPSRTDPSMQDLRAGLLERKQIARVPPEQPAAVAGEVPDDVMDRIRRHLAERVGAGQDAITVVQAEATEWPNGAMGCPQPGMNYTQAIVPGYRIVLRYQDRDYDYRVARSGHFVICEAMVLERPPAR